MGDKKITNARLDEFKKRVEEMRKEYKADKETFLEKMKNLSSSKNNSNVNEFKKSFGNEEPKFWVTKEKIDEFIKKFKEKK